MQDKAAGIRFTNNAGRAGIEEARKREGWKALNCTLLGMCLMGALWAAVSLKYC